MTLKLVLCTAIVLYSVHVTKAQFSYFDSLGEDINRRVQEHIENINNNVNAQVRNINDNVNEQVRQIKENVRTQVDGINQDVGSHISNVNEELASLGPRINEQVRKSLEPLEALKIQSKMAKGIGGVTVATYGDRNTIIYINGKKYTCPGDLLDDDPEKPAFCTIKLSPNLSAGEKLCTDNSYSRVNNIFCFGTNSALECINNSCQCINGSLYTLAGLKNICGESFGSNNYAKFIYFPNIQDTNHIQIPNPNEHVYCEEGNSNVKCTWYGNGFNISY